MTATERTVYDYGRALGVGEELGEMGADHLRGLLEHEPTRFELAALVQGFRAGVGLIALPDPEEGKEV